MENKTYATLEDLAKAHPAVSQKALVSLLHMYSVVYMDRRTVSMQEGWLTMVSLEVKLNEAIRTIELLKDVNTQLKTRIHQMQIDKAKVERDGVLREARLPEPCVRRLHEAFATSTDNAGLKQAINVEKRANNIQGKR